MATAEVENRTKRLHVKVVDTTKEGRPAVNVTVPIAIARFGLKMARAFSPEMTDPNIDWDELTALIESGEVGNLVEVDDEAEHRHVEVWVE
jgi:hypothetical protein